MNKEELAKNLLDNKSCHNCWYRSYSTRYNKVVCLKTMESDKIVCEEWRTRYEQT